MTRRLTKLLLLLQLTLAFDVSALSIDDYLEQVESGEEKLTLIDVRNPALYSQSHIPNAINIPSFAIENKRLPRLGRVVVYGDGVDVSVTRKAVELLNAKPGISAEMLDGGFAAWMSGQTIMQGNQGLEMNTVNYLTFQNLEEIAASDASLVLVDMRTKKDRTPLRSLFVDARIINATSMADKGIISLIQSSSPAKDTNLFVLIDDGDDSGARIANQLHAASMKRVAVLMGGEISLQTRGEMSEAVQIFGDRQ
jgi:rhodanese-related sulfurtransferase